MLPGDYKVELAQRVDGTVTPLAGPQTLAVVADGAGAMDAADLKALHEFQEKVARLQRAVAGALDAANALTGRLEQAKKALDVTPGMEAKWKDEVRSLEKRNREALRALRGDVTLRARNENTPVSISKRVETIVDEQRFSLARPTQMQREGYAVANQEFGEELAKLRTLIDVDLKKLEKALDAAGAPFTPGRLPEWKDK